MLLCVARGCTVSVTDAEGCRHSLDLQADSTYDAVAYFCLPRKEHPEKGLPRPTFATVFEVVVNAQAKDFAFDHHLENSGERGTWMAALGPREMHA